MPWKFDPFVSDIVWVVPEKKEAVDDLEIFEEKEQGSNQPDDK
jgi:hypothetical protein